MKTFYDLYDGEGLLLGTYTEREMMDHAATHPENRYVLQHVHEHNWVMYGKIVEIPREPESPLKEGRDDNP